MFTPTERERFYPEIEIIWLTLLFIPPSQAYLSANSDFPANHWL
ncbi:Uncharacterized protein YR821_1265 [Yersinia ruckeri]|nr:hypothetical protein yruck0001_19810 [Yersinia ruckeri ATCC 29473]QTD76194.1 Uncharacterized protein YR821_1265 [Yersinia ruckeri]